MEVQLMDSTLNNFYENLNELKKNGELCDGTIVCADGETHKFHRIVFSNLSPVLKNMLCGDGKDGTNCSVLHLPIRSTIVKKILDCAYCRDNSPNYVDLEVTWENVNTLIEASEILKISRLKRVCKKFCKERMGDGEQVCRAYNLAKTHNFGAKLIQELKNYIMKHFEKLECIGFLDFEDFFTILNNDKLNLDSEETLPTIILKWIHHDFYKRQHYELCLLQCIRIESIPLPFRQKIHHQIEIAGRMGPRLPHEVIVLYGGWHGLTPISTLDTYDTKADRWNHVLSEDGLCRAYHGMVAVSNKIYIIGGMTLSHGVSQYFNDMWCLDPVSKGFQIKAYMHYPRCYVACCALDGYIYAMGGCCGRRYRLNTAERYDIAENQWSNLPPMRRGRSDAGACASRGKVYIAGGFTGTMILASVECYDPKENQWTEIRSMIVPRSGFVLTKMHNDAGLIALGGFDSNDRLSTMECYKFLTQQWKFLADMHVGRSNFGLCQIKNKIYVFGGFDGTSTIRNSEVYDIFKDAWTELENMKSSRSAMGCCVLEGVENVAELCGRVNLKRNFMNFNNYTVHNVDPVNIPKRQISQKYKIND